MRASQFSIAFLCALTVAPAFPQDPAALLSDPSVKAALEAAKKNEPKFISEEARICEIAAPPFHENARGQELQRLFGAMGLKDVRMDSIGNVIGVRPGRSAHPNLVLAAHLDTVFPEGTNVKVTREGALLKGPGIGDDCRGLVVVLGTIQALNDAHVETPGTITFVANVGEEGLGDLRGVKNLFKKILDAAQIPEPLFADVCDECDRAGSFDMRVVQRLNRSENNNQAAAIVTNARSLEQRPFPRHLDI